MLLQTSLAPQYSYTTDLEKLIKNLSSIFDILIPGSIDVWP